MAREQFQTLTEPMYYILMALSEECCGVDIMERVRQISGGRVKVGPGHSIPCFPNLKKIRSFL